MTKEKMNGSVDLLAKAMRRVFVEAVEEGIEPVTSSVKGLEKELAELKGEVHGVKNELGGVKNELSALSGRVEHHQKALDGIKNRMPKTKSQPRG